MGIRVVQAGALADTIDRDLPDDHPETLDFHRADAFRAMAREFGCSAAHLAHRYALSMADVDTVVLGVKNRAGARRLSGRARRRPAAARGDGAHRRVFCGMIRLVSRWPKPSSTF